MLIYNVTTQVPSQLEPEWLHWMTEEHIPEVVSSGCFTHHRITRMLEPAEPGFATFAVQYFCSNPELYQEYLQRAAPALRKKAQDRWGENAVSFRSLMEVIN